MEKTISVEEYIKAGGKLENLNLKETFYCYPRKQDKPIKSINFSDHYNNQGEQMVGIVTSYDQTFACHPMWIQTTVDYMLHPKFTM